MRRLRPWRRWLSGRRWRPSRIGPRLLAFNLLVVFVPVVGVLYLDVYEAHLLQAQEREMVQQARVLAAVLGDAPFWIAWWPASARWRGSTGSSNTKRSRPSSSTR